MNFIINYTIYPFDLMFSFAETDKELRSELKKVSGIKIGTDYKFEANEDGKYVYWDSGFTLIRLRKIPATPYDFGVLQHEIFHAVTCIMQTIGVILSNESDESFAYLVGFLTEAVYTKIMSKNEKE